MLPHGRVCVGGGGVRAYRVLRRLSHVLIRLVGLFTSSSPFFFIPPVTHPSSSSHSPVIIYLHSASTRLSSFFLLPFFLLAVIPLPPSSSSLEATEWAAQRRESVEAAGFLPKGLNLPRRCASIASCTLLPQQLSVCTAPADKETFLSHGVRLSFPSHHSSSSPFFPHLSRPL